MRPQVLETVNQPKFSYKYEADAGKQYFFLTTQGLKDHKN